MKRRPQQQTPEADLFSYAASNFQTVQAKPQAGPAAASQSLFIKNQAPEVRPEAPRSIPAQEPVPVKPIAEEHPPKPEAKAAHEPKLPPTVVPASKALPKIAPITASKALPEAAVTASVVPPEPAPAKSVLRSPAPFSRSLVVSIHDVSPMTQEATEHMMAELAEIGVHKLALLVVPNHHCKGHFLDHPDFCLWLQAQAKAGH